jgi:hypothetical protein
MNEKKIKELEAQIKALKEEKPRTDREILESIEGLLKRIDEKVPERSITDILKDKLPFGTMIIDEEECKKPPYENPIVTFLKRINLGEKVGE